MLKLTLAACAAVAALCAPSLSYAQKDAAGEARAAPTSPATAGEKDAAKQKRRAEGKKVADEGKGHLEDRPAPATTSKKVSAEEKALAKAKRKEAGAAATKAGSGRLEDEQKK